MLRPNMLHRGLIIVNAYDVLPSIRHMVDRMVHELNQYEIEMDVKTTAEIYAFIGSDGELYCAELPYDFILFLDKDRYIATLLEEAGYRLFNKAEAIELADDKMATHIALLHSGIHVPATVSGPLHYSLRDNDAFLNNLTKVLSFPIIVKGNYGSLGDSVFLANNMEELKQIEEKMTYKPRIFQEFIASSKGFDFRCIVVNGQFVAGMRRKSLNGDFRSNISLGGIGEEVTMPTLYMEAAEQAAKALRLDYCGVDLLAGPDGQPILCEVNSNAFVKGIEEVTRINVAGAYAKHIYETIYTY